MNAGSVNFIFRLDICCLFHVYIYFIFFLDVNCDAFILFCLLICSALNSSFSFLLTVFFAWLKARYKISVLYLRKVFLIKYICCKNNNMKCWEPLFKRLHVYMFLRTYCFFFATLWFVNFLNVIRWIISKVLTL